MLNVLTENVLTLTLFQHSTGLSGHHLLIYSMLKTVYTKLPAKIIQYRCYKKCFN